ADLEQPPVKGEGARMSPLLEHAPVEARGGKGRGRGGVGRAGILAAAVRVNARRELGLEIAEPRKGLEGRPFLAHEQERRRRREQQHRRRGPQRRLVAHQRREPLAAARLPTWSGSWGKWR